MNLEQLKICYEQLTPETIPDLVALYHDQAWFQDPFNRVQGQQAIANIFYHMFEQVELPSFEVIDVQQQGHTAWMSWVFRLRFRGQTMHIDGVSRLDFADDGRVMVHRDYWDATELYEKLPVLGKILSTIKQRLRAPQPPSPSDPKTKPA